MIVPRSAALGRGRDGFERVELEDVAREDRIRVAHQGLDLGHAQGCAETAPDRASARARQGRRRARRVEDAREAAVALAAFDMPVPDALAGEGLEALQEAGGHHRRAVALLRAGDHHVGAAERLHEIVRGLADAPLGRRQADAGAHRAVEEGVGHRPRRPRALVEPAEHHPVDGRGAALPGGRGFSGADASPAATG